MLRLIRRAVYAALLRFQKAIGGRDASRSGEHDVAASSQVVFNLSLAAGMGVCIQAA
jgi:hypothetical protein